MLMLSDFCFLKKKRDLRSFGCDPVGCGASSWWSFGGPGKKWSVKVPVATTFKFPKEHKIIDKGIS